ncbi:MAG: ABC transporter permease [Traorella sp.]
MNLIKADFFHFFKDKSTYLLFGIVFIIPILTCLMYVLMGDASFSVEKLIFQSLGTDILCVLLGLHLSMFFGKDYANHTIRNKLCYGEKRYKIACCFFIESLIITLFYILISMSSSLVFGLILGTSEFSEAFFIKLICQIAILVSFSLLITGVVISSKNMKIGFIVTVMISVIFTAISYALPMLASRYLIIEIICRSLYMIVSTMLISSINGVYSIGSFTFDKIYENALLLSLIYSILSISITMICVQKQSYK